MESNMPAKQNSEQAAISQFFKILEKLSKNVKASDKGNNELIKLTRKQTKLLEQLVKVNRGVAIHGALGFTAEKTDRVFKSKEQEKEYDKKFMEAQEELAEKLDDQLEALQKQTLAQLGLEESIDEQIKQKDKELKQHKKEYTLEQKEKKKEKREKKIEEEKKEEEEKKGKKGKKNDKGSSKSSFSMSSLANSIDSLTETFELGTPIKGITNLVEKTIIDPIKGVTSVLGTVGVGLVGAGKLGWRGAKFVGGLMKKPRGIALTPSMFETGIVEENDVPVIPAEKKSEKSSEELVSDNIMRLMGLSGSASSDSMKALQGEQSEKKWEETKNYQEESLSLLEKIAKYLSPKMTAIKGGNIGDVLKKLWDFLKGLTPLAMMRRLRASVGPRVAPTIPTTIPEAKPSIVTPKVGVSPVVASPTGVGAGMLTKLGAAALIAGGVIWIMKDFVEGYKTGGVANALRQGFLGEFETDFNQAVLSSLGKFGLLGAGIGLLVGGPVGAIAGALIGGGIGMAITHIAALTQLKRETLGTKIADFFFGGTGLMGIIGSAGKFAILGALIGTVVAPGPGTIAGALIGAGVGAVLNFIKQILPGDVVRTIGSALDWMGEKIAKAWNWYIDYVYSFWSGFFTTLKNLMSSLWVGVTSMLKMVVEGWTLIIDWIVEKLGLKEYWEMFKNKVVEITKVVTDFWNEIFGSVSQFFSDLWDSFKNVIKGYWERIKAVFSFGTISDIIPDKKEVPTEIETKQVQSKVVVEKKEGNTKLIEDQTKVIDKQAKQVEDLNKFNKDVWPKQFQKMTESQTNKIIQETKVSREEQRMYDYFMRTGSLDKYGEQYKKYAEELKKLEKETEKAGRQGELGKAITQVNNSQQNMITNIINPTTPISIQKG